MAIRTEFDQSLRDLQAKLLHMGTLVEEAIHKSTEALVNQDIALADAVIDGDDELDRLQLEIEDSCMKLIAMQQPMAKDLRKISAAWRISVELERMADNAVDIAKSCRRIAGQLYIKPLIDIPLMSEICQQMVKGGLDSYIKDDKDMAIKMSEMDHKVDALYKQVFRELLAIMLEDPKTIAQATHLLFIARHLERFGDHATNIAESVVYLVTGERAYLNE
ncbi:phosphate signaling complex protein PhoU [Heliorestis acidaminivorans]|uniref:Phosphate-specific transport system accessory protein PhoU n=1 Tax=Heliorestis acidaminivorans TaxID=553427 RepID=A0A6I0EVR7_9FIRM|nr:phosphate signaling complex protein PhoU [Heliorestis acidaminivorans]KAB2954504.1 phosphate signaling complex protein PhoU [Heliorestis acidaminivorans]